MRHLLRLISISLSFRLVYWDFGWTYMHSAGTGNSLWDITDLKFILGRSCNDSLIAPKGSKGFENANLSKTIWNLSLQ